MSLLEPEKQSSGWHFDARFEGMAAIWSADKASAEFLWYVDFGGNGIYTANPDVALWALAVRNVTHPNTPSGQLLNSEQLLTVQEYGHQFTLHACAVESKLILCDVIVTTGRDDALIIDANMPQAQSKLIDSCGNEYNAAWVQIGNQDQSSQQSEDDFPAGIPKKVRLAFEQVPLAENLIPVVLLAGYSMKIEENLRIPFCNIVVDSEILPAAAVDCDAPILAPVEQNQRTFALQKCSVNDNMIVCDVMVTPERDEFLIVDAAMPEVQSQLFDSSGNEYEAAWVSIGGVQSTDQIEGRFFANLPRKVSLAFENFPIQKGHITGFLLTGYVSMTGESIRVTFRDIPLSH